ncbi:B12-binding domain-containing radical SAM protein [Methylomonas rosea]|uniref:B12-binding domain-containing radical SAM protein n=1 Tax=Methylomonas rosea TaxID=2952227 RepID=A0ABT1TYD9_9GAMM|nr:radical SAM protein [Methylomonas sp. WSC-7]MCQ8119786.1 B12-binding domain-containing radical SAM protein [Methylomonas sp. WSC-7]
MAKVLLINPSYFGSYGSAKASITNPIFPTLGLTTIAATALQRGHQVNILDLSYRPYDWQSIRSEVLKSKPDIVGITATTPLMNQLRDISVLCKDISNDILVVGGGAHISAMPVESMEESMLDIALTGEADISFGEVCDGHTPESILGLYHREGSGKICFTGQRPLIENLDDLPIPAWHLFDPKEYKHRMSRLLARKPPATMAEFSRGCVFKCDFCASKMTMALGYRKKSPERCAEEVAIMSRLGWKEFMLADDIFTSDHDWAVRVCKAISAKQTGMAWSCTNGIRVESADDELFKAMRDSGCYRVSFGFESGNDQILKSFGKGGKATVNEGKIAVKKAREAGIDTNGFFLLGLSPDTEESMMDTIEFARELELDMLKFGLTIAFPGTPMFNEYARNSLIKSYDWDDYHIYTERPLFTHKYLKYETILRYMSLAYRRAILTNPRFILRRLIRGIRTGEFFWDAYYGIKFAILPATSANTKGSIYYGKERWPKHDYQIAPPTRLEYQVVKKTNKKLIPAS